MNASNIYVCTSKISRLFFLGAFAKLRKDTLSFVMSIRPSVSMGQLDSHSGRIFINP